ncbi:MAG: hypothetical protein JNJ54_24185 [Myxococcaceae bacterium]|nr:hypothetical protein [Myxococcaceae bacterium]
MRLPASVSFVALAVLAGCQCGPTSRPCTATAECGPGQVCVGGQCRAGSTGGGLSGTGGGLSGTGGGAAGGLSTGGGSVTGGGVAGGFGGAGGGDPFEEDAGQVDGGVIDYDGGCGPIMAGNPPYPRQCAPGTTNECGGSADTFLTSRGVGAAQLNGGQGNGFDDDCDGLVDEGCLCLQGGTTKDCWLVPATQVDPNTRQPVGWCTANAKGSVDCSGTEITTWSGVCRGAQRPQVYDSCQPGDFDCDGLSGNNQTAGCNCPTSVECPTTPLVLAPYPNPSTLPQIDGILWIKDVAKRGMATGWTWTVLGGDCDNVLPWPTFALYSQANSGAAGARIGQRTPVRFDNLATPNRYVAATGQPLIAIQASRGNMPGAGVVHPAFGLSGDYLVQGEFTLDGKSYVCTQRVEVRAPGIRAELCWDTVGNLFSGGGNDIDLHFARLQGTCTTSQGWNLLCQTGGSTGPVQDCYYLGESGCRDGSSSGPRWGYADSAASACLGWSSRRQAGLQGCTNPRLDRDNIDCNRNEQNPTSSSFCGPENINLDNPNNGDTFVIGVNHYGNQGGTSNARPHVNVYCNGRRVVSFGYNPATNQQWPLLRTQGGDDNGDFWTVATVKANVMAGVLTCDVTPIPSRHADPTRDGPVSMPGAGNGFCVDSRMNQTPAPNQYSFTTRRFIDNPTTQGGAAGTQPMMPTQWCKH